MNNKRRTQKADTFTSLFLSVIDSGTQFKKRASTATTPFQAAFLPKVKNLCVRPFCYRRAAKNNAPFHSGEIVLRLFSRSLLS